MVLVWGWGSKGVTCSGRRLSLGIGVLLSQRLDYILRMVFRSLSIHSLDLVLYLLTHFRTLYTLFFLACSYKHVSSSYGKPRERNPDLVGGTPRAPPVPPRGYWGTDRGRVHRPRTPPTPQGWVGHPGGTRLSSEAPPTGSPPRPEGVGGVGRFIPVILPSPAPLGKAPP
jgi:hypothetical protein